MRKGSLTIFSILSMMLVASSLLALLEASRFHELQRLTQLQTQIAFESVFGKYNNDLWKEYHILSCKRDSLENGLLEFGNRRIEDKDAGSNFFQFFATDVDVESFMRLTDADGLVFVQAAAGYMEESLLFEAAKELYNRYEGIKNLQEGSFYDFSSIKRALDALEKEDDFSNSIGSTGENLAEGRKKEERISSGKNLLIEIQNLQRNGVLSLVIEDINMLSNKEIELSQMISHRILPEKNMSFSTETDWYTRVLFQQYLLKHMSCYTKQEGHEMDYELEYIIGGKNTESENLKVVVNQLLAMREAANFAYLLSCPSKIEEANILAISIVGGTLNPMVVEVVKLAILAAWAFAESILDIRTLLTGGQIALLKSNENWTLDVDNIEKIGKGYTIAKNCSNGLSYVEYLGILLLFQEETQAAKRTMDMQELTLQKDFARGDVFFEDWIVMASVEVTYRYAPVFFSIQTVIPDFRYEMHAKKSFSYY